MKTLHALVKVHEYVLYLTAAIFAASVFLLISGTLATSEWLLWVMTTVFHFMLAAELAPSFILQNPPETKSLPYMERRLFLVELGNEVRNRDEIGRRLNNQAFAALVLGFGTMLAVEYVGSRFFARRELTLLIFSLLLLSVAFSARAQLRLAVRFRQLCESRLQVPNDEQAEN